MTSFQLLRKLQVISTKWTILIMFGKGAIHRGYPKECFQEGTVCQNLGTSQPDEVETQKVHLGFRCMNPYLKHFQSIQITLVGYVLTCSTSPVLPASVRWKSCSFLTNEHPFRSPSALASALRYVFIIFLSTFLFSTVMRHTFVVLPPSLLLVATTKLHHLKVVFSAFLLLLHLLANPSFPPCFDLCHSTFFLANASFHLSCILLDCPACSALTLFSSFCTLYLASV